MNNNEKSQQNRQAGMSIVEIAIALVVFMLLSSGLLIPYMNWVKNQDEKSAYRAMELIEESLYNYAARNQTRARWVEIGSRQVQLPANRPYFPCPDLNGDGVEDRTTPGTRTLTISGTGRLVTNNPLLNTGVCSGQKGALPWKTLNVPSTDPWGNFYSYRVDPMFSGALLGFDASSRSDQLDVRMPALVNTATISGTTITVYRYQVRATMLPVTLHAAQISSYQLPALVCTKGPCTPTSTDILYGSVVGSGDTVTIQQPAYGIPGTSHVNRIYDADEVVEGVPVIIVSHGSFMHGARLPNRGAAIHCLDFEDVGKGGATVGGVSVNYAGDQMQNASRVSISTDCIEVPQGPETTDPVNEAGYVQRHRLETRAGVFDDIVHVISSEEVMAQMQQRSVFPVQPLPVIR